MAGELHHEWNTVKQAQNKREPGGLGGAKLLVAVLLAQRRGILISARRLASQPPVGCRVGSERLTWSCMPPGFHRCRFDKAVPLRTLGGGGGGYGYRRRRGMFF